MKLRTIYAPAHFGNFYELSNYHEMRELFREWKAWGINGFSTWFNPSNAVDPFGKDPLYRWAREQPLKAWQRKRTVLQAAQDEGLELGLCFAPNAVYVDQLTSAGAATAREGHTTGPDLCLSNPAGRQVVVANFVNLLRFLKEGGVRLSHLDANFRDWGGCDCAACAPWVQTVLTLWEKELMPEALRVFPEIKVLFATWWVDDAEMQYFLDLLDRKPAWLDGLNVSCGYTTKLPELDVRAPYRKTVFLHISFSHDSEDNYGAKGAEVAPARLQTTFRTMADLGYDGYLAYTEGIYDDLNKCLVARLAQDPRQEVRPLVAEYCRRYFGTDERDTQVLVAAIYCMEIRDASAGDTLADSLKALSAKYGLRDNWRFEVLRVRVAVMALERRIGDAKQWSADIAALAPPEHQQYIDRIDALVAARRIELEHLERRVYRVGGQAFGLAIDMECDAWQNWKHGLNTASTSKQRGKFIA